MARQTKRLSARTVATLTKPGRHSDGDGLYLVVDASGAKRWLFLFRWNGKLKEMGLGGLASVSLADAREKADEARRVLASGRNPIEVRKAERAEQDVIPPFGAFADKLVADISPGFRSAKHCYQWAMSLKVEAAPLPDKPINEIGTDDVLGVLTPMWQSKHVTASRLRGRMERVLDAARVAGHRS